MFLYNHGGSANHGCEALARTALEIFGKDNSIILLSESPQQDIHYKLDKIVNIEAATNAFSKLSLHFLKSYYALKRTGNYFDMDLLPYLGAIRKLPKDSVEVSIGGDVYCYDDYPKFIRLHELICKRGCKTVLLGCSLEERLFEDATFIEDMRRYTYISARESLTYHLLQSKGLTNIGIAPDSAFTLPASLLPLPDGFQEYNTVGLNLSPLASKQECVKGITLENYKNLIQYILTDTDCSIALIPHVVWQGNDDREALAPLYEMYKNTGRIVMIEDHNCMKLKGFISRCKFFIGARTHATIAAYSSEIPTVVLGYSLKSRGIATDLFGTDEHYVVPVQGLKEPNELCNAFRWLIDNESLIRTSLHQTMPEYIQRAKSVGEQVKKYLE